MLPTQTNHTLAVLDTAESSARTDSDKRLLRAQMYHCLDWTMDQIGVGEDQYRRFGRGDGMLVTVPADSGVPKHRFAGPFVATLHAALCATAGAEPIRMRLSLHCGEIGYDLDDATGKAVDDAFAIGNLPLLKRTLADAKPARLAVAVSDVWHQTVLLPNRDFLPVHAYRAAVADTGKFHGTVWLYVPGYPSTPVPVDHSRSTAAPSVVARPDRVPVGREQYIDNRGQTNHGFQFDGATIQSRTIAFNNYSSGIDQSALAEVRSRLEELLDELTGGAFAEDFASSVRDEVAGAHEAILAGDTDAGRSRLRKAAELAAPVGSLAAAIAVTARMLAG